MVVSNGVGSFKPWVSTHLDGRVHVIQYLAARISAGDINSQFSEALEKAEFPPEHVLNIGIINADDSIVGTSLFIKSKLKSEKIKNPSSSTVIDDHGSGREHWNIKPGGSAIIITNRAESVVFFKDGALTNDKIGDAIGIISSEWKRYSTK